MKFTCGGPNAESKPNIQLGRVTAKASFDLVFTKVVGPIYTTTLLNLYQLVFPAFQS